MIARIIIKLPIGLNAVYTPIERNIQIFGIYGSRLFMVVLPPISLS